MTTLHFLKAHSRVGPMRKTLGLEDGTNRNYPLARKVTVVAEDIDFTKKGVKGYRELLVHHAKEGNSLYKGLMLKELNNESRSGQTDKNAKTQFLVLDIDDMETNIKLNSPCTKQDVVNAAEQVIALLPVELQTVSYVAVASSSFGVRANKMSVHIHFLLDAPVEHRLVKDWLDSLNYTQNEIYKKLTLTAAKTTVKNVVDSCLGEPSRIVYIAPPFFGPRIKNPFNDDTNRIVAVDKKVKLLDIQGLLGRVIDQAHIIRSRKEEKRKECLKRENLPTRRNKMTTMRTGDGRHVSVITDPPESTMYFAFEEENYVRYNMGSKQNNAFSVRKDNPEVVYSFNPDIPKFLFKVADPVAYSEHIAKYGKGVEKVTDKETGQVREVVRDLYIDQVTDKFVTIEYDEKNDEVLNFSERKDVFVAKEWLKFYGQIPPDPIEPIHGVFLPNEHRGIFVEDDRRYINRFNPPLLLRKDRVMAKPMLEYGEAFLVKQHCPIICEIMLNMLGSDIDAFEHFFNWVACIYQTRDKAETAWLIGGEQGTGKGLFFKLVLRKIFGDYTAQNRLDNMVDDKFNEWMYDKLIVMIDEFNMKSAQSNITRVGSMLKNLITEPTMQVRRMQVGQLEVRQYLNFIFATNDLDSITIYDKRRFNMAPRQREMLTERITTIKSQRNNFNAEIDAEVTHFAGYLKAFKFSLNKATTIMQNDVRAEIIEAGMTFDDRLFENLRSGNFAEFMTILDKPTQNLEHYEIVQLTRIKSFLISNLPHVNTGEPVYIHKDDLKMLVSYMTGKPVSDVRMGRMISTHDISQKRKDLPVGHKTKLPTRPMCVEVVWRFLDKEVLEAVKAMHTRMANSTPIKENDDGLTQEQRTMAAAKAQLAKAGM